MSRIEVSRCSTFFSLKALASGTDVWVDGEVKGYISRYSNNSILLELTPGNHILQVKSPVITSIASSAREFNIKEDETLFFQAQSNPAWLLTIYGAIGVVLLLVIFLTAYLSALYVYIICAIFFGFVLSGNAFVKGNSFIIVETDRRGNELE